MRDVLRFIYQENKENQVSLELHRKSSYILKTAGFELPPTLWPQTATFKNDVPALRTSSEAGLLSKLWQRSPSKAVRDEAFSSPSSSTTTPRSAGPGGTPTLGATAGTRKPEATSE